MAARAPAKLVVDAPGLMAFGSQNVQPPAGNHFLMLGGALRTHFDELRRVRRIIDPEFAGLARQKFGVAAQ